MKNDLREKGRQQQKRNEGGKVYSVTGANSRGHSINGERASKLLMSLRSPDSRESCEGAQQKRWNHGEQ